MPGQRLQPGKAQPVCRLLHGQAAIELQAAAAITGQPLTPELPSQGPGLQAVDLHAITRMKIDRCRGLGYLQFARRIVKSGIVHLGIHNHHRCAAAFLQGNIQQQIPRHAAVSETPIQQFFRELFTQGGILKQRIQILDRPSSPTGNNQPRRLAGGKIRHINVYVLQLATQQCPAASQPANLAAVDQHIRRHVTGYRPIRQKRQAHIAGLITHLQGAILLAALVDFHRPLIKNLPTLQMAALDGLSEPAGQPLG